MFIIENIMILNGNKLIEILPLSDLYVEYAEHRRLKVFVNKGRNCVSCDAEGVLLLITLEKNGKTRHVDLYTKDFILMTVDHIMPKAKARKLGWTGEAIESLSNKQPMCTICNGKKADKIISASEVNIISRKERNNIHKSPRAIAHLVENKSIFGEIVDSA